MSKEFGDFQTPPDLVKSVLECLGYTGQIWPRVLEPACGGGNFISGLLKMANPPLEIQAVEIQKSYIKKVKDIAQKDLSTRVTIRENQIFNVNLSQELQWKETGGLLVIGNPPWVTNSQLGVIGSSNLPQKSNLKHLQGIEALTGSSNFDISEYIWLKLIRELAAEKPTIALLCKTSVARNVLQFAANNHLPITRASMRMIDAKKWFDAAVSACLFCVELGTEKPDYQAAVYRDLQATEPESIIGMAGGQLIADIKSYHCSAFADGVCPFPWRQGVKHDAASVMELTYNSSGLLHNKLGEPVIVEPEYVYPLLKSSDLFHQETVQPNKAVIVTQKSLKQDTRQLQEIAPQLWKYLTEHADFFHRRKSSIYRDKPPFSIFGIGDYAFAPYKVGISGLHKIPKFRFIPPINHRPVMLDDTCYFIPCNSPYQAAFLTSLLNDPICLNVMNSWLFYDAKRPITKKLLQRLDLKAILDLIELNTLLDRAEIELKKIEGFLDIKKPLNNISIDELLTPL